MPKNIQSIKQFDGGLNTFSDARDISDKECSDIANFDVKQIGRLRLLGTFKISSDITAISETEGANTGPVTIAGGEELLVFKTDNDISNVPGDETWIVYLDRSSSQLLGLPLSEATPAWRKLGGALGTPFFGINGLLATSSGSAGINESGAFYFADGKLRVSNTYFGQGSFVGDGSTDLGASSIWFGHIKRDFGGAGIVNVDGWHILPAVLQDVTDDTFGATIYYGNATTGPDCAAGKFGIGLTFERNKGDGSIQFQGRRIYVTYSYDGSQETLPTPVTTIEQSTLLSQVPAPTDESRGYIAKFLRAVEYGDTTVYLAFWNDDTDTYESVHDQTGTLERLDWESSGTFTCTDGTEQVQTLNYSSIGPNTETTITNLSRAGAVLTVTSASHGLKVGDAVTIKDSTATDFNAKNYYVSSSDFTVDVIKVTVANSGATSGSNGKLVMNGSKLAGVTGWVDSGFCDKAYTIDTIVLTSGGEDYTSAPTITITGGTPETTATATATIISTYVDAITITNYGEGYDSVPTIVFNNSGTNGSNATAIATITGKLSTESLCTNKGGGWTSSDIAFETEVTYDPPGELEALDEKLGMRISLTFKPLDYASGSDWGKTIVAHKYGGPRITHVNFYSNKFDDDAGTIPKVGQTDFGHIGSFDLANGFIRGDGTYTAWAQDDAIGGANADQRTSYSTYFGSLASETYQSRTGVFPDTRSLDLRWKTATVINRRVYAGNVLMKDEAGTPRHYPDRVMKSIPNAFDTFPAYDSLDVVVDDGDEIVYLETFGGKLLQFKTETLYVIDVTNEPEYLAGTFRFRGIPSRASAAKADEGIVFANKHGVFMYNGEGVQRFIKGKIDTDWGAFYDDANPPIVAFHPKHSIIIIGKTNSATFYYYDFLSKSWTKGTDGRYSAANKTKFIGLNGEIYQGIVSTTTAGKLDFHTWIDDFPSGETNTNTYTWESKEFDFGDSGQDTVIYNVKLTYRSGVASDGNVAAISGTFYIRYNDGVGEDDETLIGTIIGTEGEWVNVELTPTNGNLKCKSAAIKFVSTTSAELNYNFEINDATIVYRNKSIK